MNVTCRKARPQFSLRSLFLFTLVCALIVYWFRPPSPWKLVSTLDTIPVGGKPRLFELSLSEEDRSAKLPNFVSAIYLRRIPESGTLVALSPVCPILGCSIEYLEERQQFRCPCHEGTFDLKGRRIKPPAFLGLNMVPFETVLVDGKVFVKWR